MIGRVRLAQDTWERITVSPLRGRTFPHDQTIVTNFENAGKSRFGLGFGLGWTITARTQGVSGNALVTTGQQVRLNTYLFAHCEIWPRSRLPLHRGSLSLTVATNVLNDALLNDGVLGLSWNRAVGDLGFTVGANFLTSAQDSSGQQTRLIRWFLGTDFRL